MYGVLKVANTFQVQFQPFTISSQVKYLHQIETSQFVYFFAFLLQRSIHVLKNVDRHPVQKVKPAWIDDKNTLKLLGSNRLTRTTRAGPDGIGHCGTQIWRICWNCLLYNWRAWYAAYISGYFYIFREWSIEFIFGCFLLLLLVRKLPLKPRQSLPSSKLFKILTLMHTSCNTNVKSIMCRQNNVVWMERKHNQQWGVACILY